VHGTRRAQRPQIPPARPSLQAVSLVLTAWLISTAICWSATKMPRAPLSAGRTPRMPRTYFACNRSSREFASSSTRTTTREVCRELRAPIANAAQEVPPSGNASLADLPSDLLTLFPASQLRLTASVDGSWGVDANLSTNQVVKQRWGREERGMRCARCKWAMATVCYELPCGVLPVAFWTAVHLHADDFLPNQRRLAP
jgi:hypothetical protein